MDKQRLLLLRNPLQSAGSLHLPTPPPPAHSSPPPLCTMSWWQVVAGFSNSGYSSSQTQWPVKKKPRAYEEKKALALKVLRQAGTGTQYKKHSAQKAKPKWKELLPGSSRGSLLHRCLLNWAETDESFIGAPLPCRHPQQDSAACLNYYYSKGHSICDRHLTLRE